MSETKVIGIALIPSERINLKVEELVTVRIGISARGEYFFPLGEKEVIDTLLKEILKEQNTSTLSMVFVAVDIAQRRRRRRRATTQTTSGKYSTTGGVS